ncbi:hypothetical protein HHL16_20715 [Pseudoflavitalea sp. G-6-1-2]|uniref:hypothetical protein n=1 Tax=Pseudoflavitalea sp. G-6-1-2 TaxID=2728841 RepID=UPI00146EAD95|nr:hypothetical protein [Pseudoflavitalea sp. G-6-1-2]NML23314.1 hypothetical protein [Pseudoflavitalea sp. G-6-1-2]
MKKSIFTRRLLINTLFFIAATAGFQLIHKNGFFTPTETVTHIIDSHLMPEKNDASFSDWSRRLFDADYVRLASAQYDRSLYMRSFFLLDLFYPFIYCAFFLGLAAYWKGTGFYRTLGAAMIICVACDLGENISFAWYLWHPQGNVNVAVANFTTIKSVLFSLGGLSALIAFLAAIIHRRK